MRLYSFRETKVNRFLFGFYILALLMLSRDSAYGLSVFGFVPSHIAMLALTAVGAAAFLWVQRKNLKDVFLDGRMVMAGIFALLFLLPMVLKRDWQLMYVSILFYILIAVFISYFMGIRKVSRYYLVILGALSLYSVLCTYFLRILPDRGILNVPIFGREGDDLPFYQFGLCTVSLEFVASRNFGIFREPGVYQFFLLLGLVLNNYKADWEKPWQTWVINGILALTMLSTFATGGLIEMALLVLFLFWDKKWYKNRKARLLAYGIILALTGAVVYILVTKNSLYLELIGIFGKFNSENDSGGSRFDSIFTDLDIFLHHPLVGAKLYDVMHAVEDNTTSTMIQFAGFGGITASLHVLAWAVLAWDKKRNLFGNLFLTLIFFMSFNTQNLSGNPMFWLFPILALLEWLVPAINGRMHQKGEQQHG